MKKNKLIFLLVLLASVKISKAAVGDTAGIFMTMENEIVFMFGQTSISAQRVMYHDEKDKDKSCEMKKMKWMIVGNRVWAAFPIKKGNKTYRLQEIVAMNSKYILMSFWQNYSYLYIYDYQSNLVEEKIRIYEEGLGAKKNNRKAYDQIKPYFKSCTEILKGFEYNLENDLILIHSTYAEQCDGAPAVMDFLKTFKDKRMEE